jgi:hypothetical protein
VENDFTAVDTAHVNEITKSADQRRALQWLRRQLAWEQALDDLRNGIEPSEARAA